MEGIGVQWRADLVDRLGGHYRHPCYIPSGYRFLAEPVPGRRGPTPAA